VVAVSSDAAAVCRGVEGIAEDKVRIILNGIDTERYTPDPTARTNQRRSFGIDAATLLIGIVARLSPEKNHQLLLRACGTLHRRGVQFHLLVIGDGPSRGGLEAVALTAGIADQVTFLGARDDVASLLPALDVFALSSTTEGISLTLLEAMSCELPVVATAVGGNPEVVDDGVTGYVVPLDDSDMADALQRFSHGAGTAPSDARSVMGKAGRDRVLRHFSLERAVEEYHALYTAALQQRSRTLGTM
jgi:glycosyltransferase involved in cell wall biosynthesis